MKSQDRRDLAVRIANLEGTAVEVEMRIRRPEHGEYALQEAADQNQDSRFDQPPATRRAEPRRYDTVRLSIPALVARPDR